MSLSQARIKELSPSEQDVRASFDVSTAILHKRTYPINEQDSYSLRTTKQLNYEIFAPGFKILCNTLYLVGYFTITQNGNIVDPASVDLQINPDVGFHSFINAIHTRFESDPSPTVETQNETNLRTRFDNFLKNDSMDQAAHLSTSIQGLGDNRKAVKPLLYGVTGTTLKGKGLAFAFPPHFILNSARPGDKFSARQTGRVYIKVILEELRKALFSSTISEATLGQYDINFYDMYWAYETMADDGKDSTCVFKTVQHTSFLLNSSQVTAPLKFTTGNCFAIVGRAMKQSERESLLYDNFTFSPTPGTQKDASVSNPYNGFSQLQFLLNDNITGIQAEPLDDRLSIVMNGILAGKLTPMNLNDPSAYDLVNCGFASHALYDPTHKDSYIFGLAFKRLIDLSRNKLSIYVKSDVTNNDPYEVDVFGYFQYVLPSSVNPQYMEPRKPAQQLSM